MIKRIVGKISLFKRGKARRFLVTQKEKMDTLIHIDIVEKKRLLSSEFDIEVSGNPTVVEYWCKTTTAFLNSL